MPVIGLDLGGTKLAAAIFTDNGRKLDHTVIPLEGRRGRDVGRLIQDQLDVLLEAARRRRITIHGVGVCVPGIADQKTGCVWAPNIPGWEHYPVRQELRQKVARQKIPVVLDSDRAAYILGETWKGSARGCANAIFMAVGTGIGIGALVDGRVLRGAHDIAGAIGWMALSQPYLPGYTQCGCFEHHASGDGLARIARELLNARPPYQGPLRFCPVLTSREVFAALESGDPIARQTLHQAVRFWGMAVANLVSLFNPERIILGGGVFGPAAPFLPAIQAEARQWAQPIAFRKVRISVSKLGPEAGLYGAGRLALEEVPRRFR